MRPYKARELLDSLLHAMYEEGLDIPNIIMILGGASTRWESYKHNGVPQLETDDGQ